MREDLPLSVANQMALRIDGDGGCVRSAACVGSSRFQVSRLVGSQLFRWSGEDGDGDMHKDFRGGMIGFDFDTPGKPGMLLDLVAASTEPRFGVLCPGLANIDCIHHLMFRLARTCFVRTIWLIAIPTLPLYPCCCNDKGAVRPTRNQIMNSKLTKQCLAELIGTFTLIFIGVGAIYNNIPTAGVGLVGVALAHGLAIAVMVSATGGISGGHLNPAVSFGIFVGGRMNLGAMLAYWISQLIGASLAGFMLIKLLHDPANSGVQIVAAGTPDLGRWISTTQGIAIEAILTFFLVFVVYGSAVDLRAPKIGGLAIGLTVCLDIFFGGPLTGAAMNPARAFGPALASGHWANHAVYWVGPLLGGGFAGLIYGRFLMSDNNNT